MNLFTRIKSALGFGSAPPSEPKKLRAWPGALCTVKVPESHAYVRPLFQGRVVKVLVQTLNCNYHPAWLYVNPVRAPYLDIDGCEPCLPDAWLTPITPPPGTEVGDETVDVPAPVKTKEPA